MGSILILHLRFGVSDPAGSLSTQNILRFCFSTGYIFDYPFSTTAIFSSSFVVLSLKILFLSVCHNDSKADSNFLK